MPKGRASYSAWLHWREAARFALVPWHTFSDLDSHEQAAIIAHYDTITTLDALRDQDAAKQAKKR